MSSGGMAARYAASRTYTEESLHLRAHFEAHASDDEDFDGTKVTETSNRAESTVSVLRAAVLRVLQFGEYKYVTPAPLLRS